MGADDSALIADFVAAGFDGSVIASVKVASSTSTERT